MVWDIDATLKLVETKFGRPQRDAASACIQSANQRLRYGNLHYLALVKDLEEFTASKLGEAMILDMAWSPVKNERDEYFLFMDYVGAHAVACVQSIHATEDLLAASVFRFLNLKNAQGNDVDEHELSLGKTLGCLARESKYATLTTQLRALHADANFEHVDALANKAKHSSIVRPMLNEDFTGVRTNRLELQFAGFSRKGKIYPQTSIADVLSPAYAKASQTLVDVGNELKRLLT